MAKHLLLVDYENIPKVDLSVLDDSYRAIIFVGAAQNPPKAATRKETAHRFKRVEFHRIAGSGKNALDFHIAFHLGRTFEAAADTVCIVISRDKGYDPLLVHLNSSGLVCRRVESFADLVPAPAQEASIGSDIVDPKRVVCGKCKQSTTIEHHGGRWCTNCGLFASRPDASLVPSRQPIYRERNHSVIFDEVPKGWLSGNLVCGWCYQPAEMADGIYDDGEWMCGACIATYAR